MYVWLLEYDGHLSKEGYDSEDKAIKRLTDQGYKPDNFNGYVFKYVFKNKESICKIYCISIK